MQITCYNCRKTWEVPGRTLLGARLRYALGYSEYSFPCPSCGAKNMLSKEEFRTNDHPEVVVPVTAAQTQPQAREEGRHAGTEGSSMHAPTNPIKAPEPAVQNRQAVVRMRGVEARRDHSNWSEIVGTFSKGERLTIVETWSDGENTWVQLGPERWINIEQDGEPVIDLIND